MWVWIGQALRWLAPVAIGWTVSDVYNESQTTGQVTAASAASSVKKSLLNKWWFYVILMASFLGFIWVIKTFKLKSLQKLAKV